MSVAADSSHSRRCPINRIILSNNDIEKLQSMVYDNELELCSPVIDSFRGSQVFRLEFDNLKMTLGDRTEYVQEGITKVRGSCTLDKKYYIQIHSHPAKNDYISPDVLQLFAEKGMNYINPARPFPSMDDIKTVLKHYEIICHSIISTSWGLWFISNTDKGKDYFKLQEEKKFYDWITHKLLPLHKIYDNTREISKYIPDDNIEKYINTKVDDLGYKIKLRIKFYSWTTIKKGQNGTIIELPV